MTGRKKLGIAALVVAVVAIAAGLLWLDNKSRQRNTAEAKAEILKVRLHVERRSSGSNRRENRIDYRYAIGGRWIEDRIDKPAGESWAVGRPVKVCYDPTNPKRHRLEQASYRCGS
ncbi:MAG TPA: DUF3592 domain-containing protein [Allosphingosinicella sp.]|jgi:hypothetical protein